MEHIRTKKAKTNKTTAVASLDHGPQICFSSSMAAVHYYTKGIHLYHHPMTSWNYCKGCRRDPCVLQTHNGESSLIAEDVLMEHQGDPLHQEQARQKYLEQMAKTCMNTSWLSQQQRLPKCIVKDAELYFPHPDPNLRVKAIMWGDADAFKHPFCRHCRSQPCLLQVWNAEVSLLFDDLTMKYCGNPLFNAECRVESYTWVARWCMTPAQFGQTIKLPICIVRDIQKAFPSSAGVTEKFVTVAIHSTSFMEVHIVSEMASLLREWHQRTQHVAFKEAEEAAEQLDEYLVLSDEAKKEVADFNKLYDDHKEEQLFLADPRVAVRRRLF